MTGYNTAGQSRALDSLWRARGFESSKKPGGEDDEKPSFFRAFPDIYRAKWMRKPGDPDYEEDEGEKACGEETSTRPEPVMSDPEPTPSSARPEVVPQSPTVRPGGNTTNRAVEPGEPLPWVPGANFGRFQGL